jgi:hypothetical protein
MAGHSTRLVSTPSWRPNTQTVLEALADLHVPISEHSNIAAVIYFCLDAAAFYAMTEYSIIPIAKDGKGDYHVFGSLVTAPADMFSKSLKTCLPLFSAVNATTKIVLSPLPKYWQERCCEDEEHVSNIKDPDFEAVLFSGLDSLRRVTKDVLHTSGINNFKVYNTSQLCSAEAGAKMTSASTRDALAVMWKSDDPVHPSEDTYATLASNILHVLEATAEKASLSLHFISV